MLAKNLFVSWVLAAMLFHAVPAIGQSSRVAGGEGNPPSPGSEPKGIFGSIKQKLHGGKATEKAPVAPAQSTEEVEREFGLGFTAAVKAIQSGDYKLAASNCEKTFVLAGKLEEPDLKMMKVATAYGASYEAVKKYPEAEFMYLKALHLVDKTSPTDARLLSTMAEKLAEVYALDRKYTNAEELYKLTIALRDKAYGPENTGLVNPLNALAGVYQAEGKLADAEQPMKRSTAIVEKTLGSESRDLAISLNNLASLYRAMGKKEEAETLLKRSLAILDRTDPEHPYAAAVLTNYADFLRQNDRPDEAAALQARAKEILEKQKPAK